MFAILILLTIKYNRMVYKIQLYRVKLVTQAIKCTLRISRFQTEDSRFWYNHRAAEIYIDRITE